MIFFHFHKHFGCSEQANDFHIMRNLWHLFIPEGPTWFQSLCGHFFREDQHFQRRSNFEPRAIPTLRVLLLQYFVSLNVITRTSFSDEYWGERNEQLLGLLRKMSTMTWRHKLRNLLHGDVFTFFVLYKLRKLCRLILGRDFFHHLEFFNVNHYTTVAAVHLFHCQLSNHAV